MRGVDLLAKDLDKFPSTKFQCYEHCVIYPQISATSWSDYNGGTCWVKQMSGNYSPSRPSVGVDSTYRVMTFQGPVTWSAVTDGADMPGNDLNNVPGGSIADCKTACAATINCFAVTWTNFQGGRCWLKYRASAYGNYPGAKSSYLARSTQ